MSFSGPDDDASSGFGSHGFDPSDKFFDDSSLPSFLLEDDNSSGLPFDSLGGSGQPSLKFGNLDYISPEAVAPALGVYGGGNDLDYLFAEDIQDYRKKPWGEQLSFWTGTSWLIGGAVGSMYEIASIFRNTAGKSIPFKLRVNSILNAFGKRGLMVANMAGVLALMLSSFESAAHHFITHDDSLTNYAIAGTATGLAFKSTKLRSPGGLKQAAMWSAGLSAATMGIIYPSRQGYFGKEWRGVV